MGVVGVNTRDRFGDAMQDHSMLTQIPILAVTVAQT
jgi:hypothetical protein